MNSASKKVLLSGVFCLATTALAHAESAGTWERDGWPGEYPTGLRVNQPVSVQGHAEPKQTAPAAGCVLAPGIYHPWEGTPTLYRSQIAIYRALSDQEEGPIRTGETIRQLSYLSEGFCILQREAGEIFEATCPEIVEGAYEVIKAPDFRADEEWFQATCTGGTTAWVLKTEALFQQSGVEHFIPEGI
jgi:hypothetical protein